MAFKRKEKRNLSAGLSLTSLVDCFSILIVYLLMATSFGENLIEAPKDISLPKSAVSDGTAPDVVVEVRGRNYNIQGKSVAMSDLVSVLKSLASKIQNKDEKSLVIQADERSQFGELNPIVTAGMVAGFNKVQFAVVQEDL